LDLFFFPLEVPGMLFYLQVFPLETFEFSYPRFSGRPSVLELTPPTVPYDLSVPDPFQNVLFLPSIQEGFPLLVNVILFPLEDRSWIS